MSKTKCCLLQQMETMKVRKLNIMQVERKILKRGDNYIKPYQWENTQSMLETTNVRTVSRNKQI